MARQRPADDATAIGKIYPQDRHSRAHPHHDAAPTKTDQSPEYTDIKETDDVYKVLKNAYPQNRNKFDSTPPERASHRMAPIPDWDAYRASFRDVRNSPMSRPAVDESAPQFAVEKSEHLNDCNNTWVRGTGGQSPHPRFDGNRLSGAKGNRHD